MRIAVLPIGSVDSSILEDLQFSLSEVFPYTDAFILKDSLHLPKETYDPIRDQYQSSKILLYIEAHHHRFDADRILGVAGVDLYIPGLSSFSARPSEEEGRRSYRCSGSGKISTAPPKTESYT